MVTRNQKRMEAQAALLPSYAQIEATEAAWERQLERMPSNFKSMENAKMVEDLFCAGYLQALIETNYQG